MTNKCFYIAVIFQQDGKNYAYAIKCATADNLCYKLARPGIIAANICATKKAAAELVHAWNNSFLENGTYLFAREYEARA